MDAMLTAKHSSSGFSVGLFWPTPASGKDLAPLKKKEKEEEEVQEQGWCCFYYPCCYKHRTAGRDS